MNSINLFQRFILSNCLIRNFSRAPSLLYCSAKGSGDEKDGKPGKFAKFFEDFSVDKNLEPEEVELKPEDSLKRFREHASKSDQTLRDTDHEHEPKTDWKLDYEGEKLSAQGLESRSEFDIEDDSEWDIDFLNKKQEPTVQEEEPKLGKFARAFEKFSKVDTMLQSEPELTDETEPESEEQQTFTALLRNSKFIDLGDPKGKVVTGNVYHVIGDDLYIDFGWKFPTICPRPARGGENYIRGTKVRILIKDLELSTKFLGSTVDTTLNEADCILLGLARK